jgi:exonuclease SbcD
VRLVHTSDWHLGAWLGAVDRRPDLEAAIDALVELVAEVQPDLVLHTGDLFDRALPAGDDLRFAADALARLAGHAPVLVLCGNHDGRHTFLGLDGFCTIDSRRVRLLAAIDLRRPLLEYPAAGGSERLRVGAVPYLPLAAAGFEFLAHGQLGTGAYADRIRDVWSVVDRAFAADRSSIDVDVAAAHLHVAGSVLAHSEKQVHTSDATATDAAAVPAVSYAAYGHIHRPQALPGSLTGRYAGSIVPIDFGEAGEDKGAVVVEGAPGRAARVEFVPLASGRPLVDVTGPFEAMGHLLAPHRHGIVRVTVTDRERIEHLAERVVELLPEGAVHHTISQPALARRPPRPGTAPDAASDADTLTLLRDYVRANRGDGPLVDELAALWATAEADPSADLSDGALDRLTAVLGEVPAAGSGPVR